MKRIIAAICLTAALGADGAAKWRNLDDKAHIAGEKLTESDLRGRVVLVYYWAVSQEYAKSMPLLDELVCETDGTLATEPAFDKFYLPKPDGLCGNDDCGQMSAWYLFSAMGFYPFNPCGGTYVLGAPQIPKATIAMPGGKKFVVVAKNLSKENKYVKSVTLNGKPITDWKIRHSDIMAGGELVFEMTNASEHFEAKPSI